MPIKQGSLVFLLAKKTTWLGPRWAVNYEALQERMIHGRFELDFDGDRMSVGCWRMEEFTT
jgi:hypothetical protein